MQRKEIEERLILAGVVGSTAYGLNRPDSDIDVKGICVAPKEFYLGYKSFEVKDHGWADLIAIRNDDKSYEYVMGRAQELQDEMEGLYKTTSLRNEVSNEYLNNLCVELVEEYGW